jgi:hypothetical protein
LQEERRCGHRVLAVQIDHQKEHMRRGVKRGVEGRGWPR